MSCTIPSHDHSWQHISPRIGTAGRDRAIEKVHDLYSSGYLDDAELGTFTTSILTSRYEHQIRDLFSEFPGAADLDLFPQPKPPFRAAKALAGFATMALGLCMAVIVPLYSSFTPKGMGISINMQVAGFFAIVVGVGLFAAGCYWAGEAYLGKGE
jgi:hypothetical protein